MHHTCIISITISPIDSYLNRSYSSPTHHAASSGMYIYISNPVSDRKKVQRWWRTRRKTNIITNTHPIVLKLSQHTHMHHTHLSYRNQIDLHLPHRHVYAGHRKWPIIWNYHIHGENIFVKILLENYDIYIRLYKVWNYDRNRITRQIQGQCWNSSEFVIRVIEYIAKSFNAKATLVYERNDFNRFRWRRLHCIVCWSMFTTQTHTINIHFNNHLHTCSIDRLWASS